MDDADTFGGIPVCHLDRMVVEHVFQFHGSNHVFIYSVSVFFLAAGEIVYAESDGGEEHRLGIAGGFVRVLRDEVEACVEVNDEKY